MVVLKYLCSTTSVQWFWGPNLTAPPLWSFPSFTSYVLHTPTEKKNKQTSKNNNRVVDTHRVAAAGVPSQITMDNEQGKSRSRSARPTNYDREARGERWERGKSVDKSRERRERVGWVRCDRALSLADGATPRNGCPRWMNPRSM